MTMNYSHIINEMVWSYSRIGKFETCPYQFLLSYIFGVEKKRLFFSDYGSFIHSIIEKYFNKDLKKRELSTYYLSEFQRNVVGKAPNISIFENYFQQGLSYLNNFDFPYSNVIAVEKKFHFRIGKRKFIGIVDAIADDNGIIIIDNKSRSLKPYSNRKKPTLSDMELDNYFKQLYLYSVGIKKEYKSLPKALGFNCFRTQTSIIEPFDNDRYIKTKKWATNTIDTIINNTDWSPKINYFICNNLCDVCHHCEYHSLGKR